jgi:hypothetical protein
MKSYALLLLAAACLAGCQSFEPESPVGLWQVESTGNLPEAQLRLRSDNTFHVDIPARDGIEVEGHYLLEGREITFVNDRGTDTVASDPAPGVYVYSAGGDTLSFEKIEDPLERRARFLSRPWRRQ